MSVSDDTSFYWFWKDFVRECGSEELAKKQLTVFKYDWEPLGELEPLFIGFIFDGMWNMEGFYNGRFH